MTALDWILSILLFIVSLGILIVIHELGHFSMAKLFNVYCQEFSIGFGPKLLHKRRKGKETYFSIRAIPLGGYVAMYGEGMELEDGVVLPRERSIEGIKRWKKAIVLIAGVTLNALLALTLFAVSNLCFPQRSLSRNISVTAGSIGETAGLKSNDKLYFFMNENGEERVLFDQEEISGNKYSGAFYILSDDVTYNSSKYVFCWAPTTNNSEPKLSESFKLYPADTEGKISKTKAFADWNLVNYPDITKDALKAYEGASFNLSLGYFPFEGKDEQGQAKYGNIKITNITFTSVIDGNSYKWKDVGIANQLVDVWLDFGTRVKNTFTDFGNASVAVFKGIGTLFTSGIKNMSGIIGIFSQSATILTKYTFNQYLYFWGLISVNLAIFNLLPFPGLDGWALLVTAIEGGVNLAKRKKHSLSGSTEPFKEWKIPEKVKNIVSYVGLALLFILMLAIVGIDIARLVK